MLSDFYDETEPIVNPEALNGKQKHLIDKCLILFSIELYNHFLSHFECEQIAVVKACNGDVPIHSLEYKGERIAFYLSPTGSAMASAFCSEANWLTGAMKFVMFGSCGSLDQEKTKGHFIIPTESYRGEGCSYYYAPAADYIRIKTADRLSEIFTEIGVPFVKGRNWTTDAMMRETKGLVARRKEEGCISVEMELAGVQALCDFCGLTLYDFLEAGDVLSESGYEVEGLNDANHSLNKLFVALEVALRI
ncbi:MAG: nucleoside phosphorylase [Erysipelotrichaceae bacterium]|nr:nucleoside phosphorylase [Erysipelotrichaceae bacterium]